MNRSEPVTFEKRACAIDGTHHRRMTIDPLSTHRDGRARRSRGFTLVELLVVIVVIAIVVAVAAPSLLGQAAKAHDSAAEQRLASLHKAAYGAAVERGEPRNWPVGVALRGALEASEPEIGARTTLTDAPARGRIGVCANSDADTLRLVAHSASDHAVLLTAAIGAAPRLARGTCAGHDERATFPADAPGAERTGSPYGDAVLLDGPIAFWRFETRDAAGGADSSGYGRALAPKYGERADGGFAGLATGRVAGGGTTTDESGSWRFYPTGTSGPEPTTYAPAAMPVLRDGFTVEAWLGAPVAAGDEDALVYSAVQGDWRYSLLVPADSRDMRCEATRRGAEPSPASRRAVTWTPPEDEADHRFYACVFDRGRLSLYADGAPVGTAGAADLSLPDVEPTELFVGHRLDALLDEVAVFDRPLAADRIAAHWAVGH